MKKMNTTAAVTTQTTEQAAQPLRVTESTLFTAIINTMYHEGNRTAATAKTIETNTDKCFIEYKRMHADLHKAVAALLGVLPSKDRDAITAAENKAFPLLKAIFDLSGVLPEQSDLYALIVNGFTARKAKDEQDETTGKTITGKVSTVPVSESTFRKQVEVLAGQKMNGFAWDTNLNKFRAKTDDEIAREDKRIKKYHDKKKAEQDALDAQRQQVLAERAKADAKKSPTAKKTTKADAKNEEAVTQATEQAASETTAA